MTKLYPCHVKDVELALNDLEAPTNKQRGVNFIVYQKSFPFIAHVHIKYRYVSKFVFEKVNVFSKNFLS